MTEQQLNTLIKKYLSGSATNEEKAQVEQWYESFDATEIGFSEKEERASFLRSWLMVKGKIADAEKQDEDEEVVKQSKHKVLYRWAAVAAILILLSGTFYFLLNQNRQKGRSIAIQQQVKKDFKPGGNKAVLTLGNGKKIILDSSNTGLLSMQGNTKVLKLNKGLLSYVSTGSTGQSATGNRPTAQPTTVSYNTISTPRGGQYEIVLPDGSKVWLNAASSLRFPTSFAREKRVVEMTGEAYFEIAKNANKPFLVKKGATEIKVLGTHFNVKAYANEDNLKVTLLEGLVRVSNKLSANGQWQKANSKLLSPGEQAIVGGNDKIVLAKRVNRNKIMAWKNHLFWFENSNINEVVKELARWYDVDIEIEGDIPDLFTGSIPRNLSFSEVFDVLQKTGSVDYEIVDNRKIVVTP